MGPINELGKFLLIFGVLLVAVGGLLILFGRIPGLGRLPGDIAIEGKRFRLYFPLATCLLLSLVATLVLYLIRSFLGR